MHLHVAACTCIDQEIAMQTSIAIPHAIAGAAHKTTAAWNATELGIALLRVSLGVMFLAHSVVLKLLTYGLPGTAQFFVSLGLPAWFAYAAFFAEAIGGALLVLGVHSRYVALLLAPILIGALAVHSGNGWVFTAPNGGW